jgi:hypothetical protein
MLYPSRSGVVPFVSRLDIAEAPTRESCLGTIIVNLMVQRSLDDRLVVVS